MIRRSATHQPDASSHHQYNPITCSIPFHHKDYLHFLNENRGGDVNNNSDSSPAMNRIHRGGGFHGHWADDHLDVEYTSYALLALGHLSL